MAGGVPVVYRKTGEGSLANYNWVDIANGAGYNTFYLCSDTSGNPAVASYALVSENIYSDQVVWMSPVVSATISKIYDHLFTTTLNMPKVVNGNVLVNIASCWINAGNAASSSFAIQFIKIRDGVETTIGTGVSAVITYEPTTYTHNKMVLVKIPIVNEIYKKRDKIGIRLQAYAVGDAGFSKMLIGIDPQNRTSIITGENALTTTISKVNIPFRIDL